MEGITHSMDMNLSKLKETVKDRGAWRVKRGLVVRGSGEGNKCVYFTEKGGRETSLTYFSAVPLALMKALNRRTNSFKPVILGMKRDTINN